MKKTAKVYVVSFPDKDASDGYIVAVWSFRPSGPEFNVHQVIEVEYEEPSHSELVSAAVFGLEAKRKDITARAEAEKVQIDGQIQSLMALEQIA